MSMSFTYKFQELFSEIFIRKYPWRAHFFFETLGRDDIMELLRFLVSGNSLQHGEYIGEYEEKFKGLLEPGGFAFSFGAGRMALYAILDALDIGEGDEVILPAFTCEVVVHALLYRKIKPVFADIEPRTFNIDVKKLEQLITPKTKAVIAQHTFGVPCELEEILDISNKYGIYVIEDCALALGSNYKGRPVGTHGHASFFSTDRTKLISTLWGGMAFTTDKETARKIGLTYLRSPFPTRLQSLNMALQALASYVFFSPFLYPLGRYIMAAGYKSGLFFHYRDNKAHSETPVNYPSRLSNVQAVLGLKQLEKLPTILKARKEAVKNYAKILGGNGIDLTDARVDEITLRFSVLLKERNKFRRKFNKYFESGMWFNSPAIGWYKHLERISYSEGKCPVAEHVHKHVVNFPTYQTSKVVEKFLYKIASSIGPDDIAVYK